MFDLITGHIAKNYLFSEELSQLSDFIFECSFILISLKFGKTSIDIKGISYCHMNC